MTQETIKFIEDWYGSSVPQDWDKDYDPLKNVTLNDLGNMLETFYKSKIDAITDEKCKCGDSRPFPKYICLNCDGTVDYEDINY